MVNRERRLIRSAELLVIRGLSKMELVLAPMSRLVVLALAFSVRLSYFRNWTGNSSH